MTNLAEFSAYYMRSIWRTGDPDLTTDLPRLVKEAEARISRDLRDTDLIRKSTVRMFSPDTDAPLPADCREIVSVDLGEKGTARTVAYEELLRMRRRNAPDRYPYYSIAGRRIYFAGFGIGMTQDPPGGGYLELYLGLPYTPDISGQFVDIDLTYYAGITPFPEEEGATSFYDLNPDFFMAAMHAQVYTYLREFELSAEHNGKYLALLEDMRRQSNYTMFPSGQFSTPLSAEVR